jgi:ubiquinone/menaquinone biosynthesis C-methylase UbiE
MQKQMTNLWFRLMALEYRLKSDPVAVLRMLKDAGVQPGMSVLDFGCGPGRYAVPAARIVAREGVVYSVDLHPLAIKMVENTAEKERLRNLHAIRSDCGTGLPFGSIDIVLLYNALHDVADKEAVLKELHRVLKPQGMLCCKDHTLKGAPLFSLLRSNVFSLQNETTTQFVFKKC